jgi:hypothetical protein
MTIIHPQYSSNQTPVPRHSSFTLGSITVAAPAISLAQTHSCMHLPVFHPSMSIPFRSIIVIVIVLIIIIIIISRLLPALSFAGPAEDVIQVDRPWRRARRWLAGWLASKQASNQQYTCIHVLLTH